MKNRLQLSPKVSTKVSVKHTLVYAAAGAGIFALLFIGAFFYFNFGNSERTLAAVEITSDKSGNWTGAGTWSSNIDQRKDVIITIEAGHTVTLSSNLTYSGNVELYIKGALIFDGGKLTLEPGSTITIQNGAEMIAIGGGNSDHINIGKGKNGHSWKGDNINLQGPLMLDQAGESIPELLPIVLDHFKATATASNTVLIEWGTFSEKDNDFFTLEHSTDGKTFEIITTMDGAGNSNKKLSYSFEDTNPVAGMNYYRLKQTDFNGDFEYFKIVGVNNKFGSTNASVLSEAIQIGNAWPNPFKDQINIIFEAETEGEVEVLIQNALGEIVHKAFFPFHYGKNTYTYNKAGHLRPGVYFVNFWQNGKKFEPQRLIKM